MVSSMTTPLPGQSARTSPPTFLFPYSLVKEQTDKETTPFSSIGAVFLNVRRVKHDVAVFVKRNIAASPNFSSAIFAKKRFPTAPLLLIVDLGEGPVNMELIAFPSVDKKI